MSGIVDKRIKKLTLFSPLLHRAVHILPNRFVKTIGEHDDFPVEGMRLSRDGNILASCSHDQTVKFWDVSCLKSVNVDLTRNKKHFSKNPSSDFFADL